MDWMRMNLPEPKPERWQAAKLAALYHWRLAVLARVMNKSAAQLIAQSVEHYLESNWESHDRLIEAECPPGMEVETFIQQIISTD